MTPSLRTLLREGDPVTRNGSLDPADAQRMRRIVLDSRPVPEPWSWIVPVAALTAVTLVAAVAPRFRASPASPAASTAPVAAIGTVESERRQLQFVTPGGTRVIWTFDSRFPSR